MFFFEQHSALLLRRQSESEAAVPALVPWLRDAHGDLRRRAAEARGPRSKRNDLRCTALLPFCAFFCEKKHLYEQSLLRKLYMRFFRLSFSRDFFEVLGRLGSAAAGEVKALSRLLEVRKRFYELQLQLC